MPKFLGQLRTYFVLSSFYSSGVSEGRVLLPQALPTEINRSQEALELGCVFFTSQLKWMLQDEILPWFEKKKPKRKEKRRKKKRKLPLRVLNSKWKVSRSRIGSAQNFRLR